jgi:cell division inhibitor SepF
MTFWDNVKKFAQPMGDDEYDDFDEEMDGFEEEAEPIRPARRETRSEPAATTGDRNDAGSFSGKVLSMNSNKPSVVLFRPTSFNEATKAADDLRERKAVIVNMENVEPSMARRVVDFLSGCAYALDGKVKKIALATYLFCPHSMDVMGDLETLQTESESGLN